MTNWDWDDALCHADATVDGKHFSEPECWVFTQMVRGLTSMRCGSLLRRSSKRSSAASKFRRWYCVVAACTMIQSLRGKLLCRVCRGTEVCQATVCVYHSKLCWQSEFDHVLKKGLVQRQVTL